jgi:hypothetical protein
VAGLNPAIPVFGQADAQNNEIERRADSIKTPALWHDPEKVDAGFPKRSCPIKSKRDGLEPSRLSTRPLPSSVPLRYKTATISGE